MEGDLIGEYVAALRHRLAWRRDIEDLSDEVEDHLREQCERLVDRGTDPTVAQQETLRLFGDLGLVARSYVETSSGGLAVPTRGTRMAGFAGVAAGVLWSVAVVGACLGGLVDGFHPWTLIRYLVWAPTTVAALVLTAVTLAGALGRVGRLRTRSGIASLVVMGLVILVLGPMTWAVLPVMLPCALAAVFALRGHCGDAETIVRPLRLLAVWVPALGVLGLLTHVVPIGPVDEYGDRPYAVLVAFVVGAMGSALATGWVGRSLAREHPIDLDHTWPRASAVG